jgi:hypothetical protein
MIVTKMLADDLLLLTKEEAVLEGVTERQNETGRCNEMEMNVETNKMMRFSEIMLDQKQQEKVENFNYLDCIITNDARCKWKLNLHCNTKSRFQQDEE